ncbi:hypothetical protein CCR75_002077 [Bremia lactucae]|uniref:Uncharacterized protein n=1 Tax=Bremia lactucae TaxID=4779 RepID=A0A976IJM2_BRELC|nr:hypothetical protein CCR75_002077 [Bremia lactucae]
MKEDSFTNILLSRTSSGKRGQIAIMKYRFCGGLEPPDWIVAELPLLSGDHSKVVRKQFLILQIGVKHYKLSLYPLQTLKDLTTICGAIGEDIALQELDFAYKLIGEAAIAKVDHITILQAVVAVLRFILTHAAKYNVDYAELVEELQQLGMRHEVADTIVQSYEDLRANIQDQQRLNRFKFPGIEKVEWRVKNSHAINLNLRLDQPIMDCNVATMSECCDLTFEMTSNKFLALYEELKGFLLCQRDEAVSLSRIKESKPSQTKATIGNVQSLHELYVVLTMNRKLEFFDNSDAETRNKIDGGYLMGFGGWDGNGLLKVDSYGLELKVERNVKPRMHLAALNRVDLEKWCRGFMAVLDPHSTAGEEVRRERRRVKKEEKRLQKDREEQIRKWKEKKARMIQEEQDRLLAREEEINNMTPLERINDIGSLDENTARMLEKRKQRLQRRHAPTMERVNKAAYRRRLDEAAGGKTENMQPLHTRTVEQKAKIRIELPPPGQCTYYVFIFSVTEVGGVVHRDVPIRLGSSGSDVSDTSSISSRLSSVSSVTGYRHETSSLPPPPPTPPRWTGSSSRTSSSRTTMGFPPPPPPTAPFDHVNDRASRISRSSSSLRSASFDSLAFGQDEDSIAHRSSFSQTSQRALKASRGHQSIQDNLAAIIGRERSSRTSRTTHRRDSFGAVRSSITSVSYGAPERKIKETVKRAIEQESALTSEPRMANAFAASLAAIRRNRADTFEEVDITSFASSPVNVHGKMRNRDSQLSAEGKEIFKKAMAQEKSLEVKLKTNCGRKGLFDDSSEDDDGSDTGLFGTGTRDSKAGNRTSRVSSSFRSSDLSTEARPPREKKATNVPSVRSDDSSSDSDSDNAPLTFTQPHAKSVPTNNIAAGGAGPSVVVLITSSALRTEGKKKLGVFTFTLQYGNLEHTFSLTYSEFEEIHLHLMSAIPELTMLKFPSKHRLRNNSKPENMEKRAQELRLYLQQLVAVPGILLNEHFLSSYRIDDVFARSLVSGENEKNFNGVQLNGRPPRSPVARHLRKDQTNLPIPSRSEKKLSLGIAKPKVSKDLFGLEDSMSDPESDSDTSVDTPQPIIQQQRLESTSSAQRRKARTSDLSSSNISMSQNGNHWDKKSRSRSRLSSRASFRASFASSQITAESPVSFQPPGRPNPFAGGRGDLLAAIRQGAPLKNIDVAKSTSSGGPLASKTKASSPLALTQPSSVNEAISNAMAMRRIHVEYEETKSDCECDTDQEGGHGRLLETKYRFCGGLEPPDWIVAELPLLSGDHSKVVRKQFLILQIGVKHYKLSLYPLQTLKDLTTICGAIGEDIALQELDFAYKLIGEAAIAKVDHITILQAVVAVLRFILTHAAKYNVDYAELVEELQQLGMRHEVADTIVQSYEDLRANIQDQQRLNRFKFPGIEKVEWRVKNSHAINLNLRLDQPIMDCNVATMSECCDLTFEMTSNKFLALYEELKGFLLCQRDEAVSLSRIKESKPSQTKATIGNVQSLHELYVVLTMNRKLEFFDNSDAETRNKIDGGYLMGFGGWDGNGLLKVDSYGLELKVERNVKPRMHLAALNRVDLEKWCRGFMAVLDPHSTAGEEVRRERRRVKKEEKRLQKDREEQIRKWKEKKARMIQEEQDRLLAREEEINNMTPLERINDIGSLDENTARMLEKRKQRLQRRHAPTMERVNKAAYRRRLDEAAGGKTENMQPLHTRTVEQKAKIRIELPPPGQCTYYVFIFSVTEVGGVVHRDVPIRLGSSGSDVSDTSSISSRLSSVSSVTGYRHETSSLPPPPPTPPRWTGSSSRTSSSRTTMGFPPPPPPTAPFDHVNDRASRISRSSSSLRSASFDSLAFGQDEDSIAHRSSFSQTSQRALKASRGHQSIQDNLAAIIGRERSSRTSRTTHRRDSFGAVRSSITSVSYGAPERKIKETVKRAIEQESALTSEPRMANAFAASLAAIRRNRADTFEEVDITSFASSPVNVHGKMRNRDSQLSAEGKEIFKKAMAQEKSLEVKLKTNCGRKGLFDDSSEDDDGSDTGLFGTGTRDSKAGNRTSRVSSSFRSSDLSTEARPPREKKATNVPSVRSDDSSSDSDSDNAAPLTFTQPHAKSVPTNNIAAGGAGPSVVVLITSSALRTEGKKKLGVFTFTLQYGNLEHTFSLTYSEFEEIHLHLMSAIPELTMLKFPSKHRLRNNSKPENMEKRAQELRLYLQQLVAVPGILLNEHFLSSYRIDDVFARSLVSGENEKNFNGVQLNGRPPRSPVARHLRKDQTNLPIPSRSEKKLSLGIAKPKVSKDLFGLEDSMSDPESDSDTSVDTPQPIIQQQRLESTSSAQRRKARTSDLSSSNISMSQNGNHWDKKSRSRSRLSSRASFRASFASSQITAESPVSFQPPGRPNPFAGGRGDLLAAIRQGAPLKNIDVAKSTSSGGPLASKTKASSPLALTQPSSVNEAISNAMAMRRIHVEYEETKSDCESDSDDDWD